MANGTTPLVRSELRAELAEMELRLRIFLTDELLKKADRIAVETLAGHIAVLQETVVFRSGPLMADLARMRQVIDEGMAGNMNPAQERMLNEWLATQLEKKNVKKWTLNQRLVALGVGALAVGNFIINILQTGTP